jgi:cytochrome c biogenesis protein CcdA
MLVLSFLAGALTSLSPCVLPLIPVLLGSALQKHPMGPLTLALGLSLSFATLGVMFASAGFVVGIDAGVLRVIAAMMMAGFGIILLIRPLQDRLVLAGAPITNRLQGRLDASRVAAFSANSSWGSCSASYGRPALALHSARPLALPPAPGPRHGLP